MKKLDIKNPRFRLVDSTLKGCKEVEVVFNYNGEDHKYFIFVDEGKNTNYINEAKKQFNQDVKSGKVLKTINVKPVNHRPWLIAGASVLGVATIIFASLFTWKMVANNGDEPKPTPTDETYNFTFTGTNCSIDGQKSFTKEFKKDTTNIQFTVDPDDGFQLDYYHAEGINLEGNTLTIDKMDKDYTVNLNGIDDDIAVIMDYNIVASDKFHVEFTYGGNITSIDWGDGQQTINDVSEHDYTAPGKYKVVVKGALTSFSKPSDSVTNINIYSPIESISDNSFFNCATLTTVNLPNSVKSIGVDAFCKCFALTSIVIPSKVTSIGDYAFSSCYNLTSVNIPNSVTSIGVYAFSSCFSLISINIPNSVTEIAETAFNSCTALISVILPDSVKSIGAASFGYCYSLTSIHIPNSVTKIAEGAFSNCRGLISINIPNSVISIEETAFYDCSSLSIVDLTGFKDPNSIPESGPSAFGGEEVPANRLFYVANDEMKAAFSAAENWSDLATRFTTDPVPSV